MIEFIKNWTLPIAILTGIIGQSFFMIFADTIPYFIFFTLFLACCKLNLSELKLRKWHFILLSIQTITALGAYFLLYKIDNVVAQSAMLCFICPTATAASIITMKLEGNMSSITTYILLTNALSSVFIPVVFPIIEPQESVSFLLASAKILLKVLPLLILPFILALIIRFVSPRVNEKIARQSWFSFYIWALSLIIVTSKTTNIFVESGQIGRKEILLILMSLLTCLIQFFIGRRLGDKYADKITVGQALGQKNTIFAMWVGETYLNPASAIAPGIYLLWQNIFNSFQLWRHRKNAEKQKE